MKLITFSDYDGHIVTVRAALIESIRRPSGRVNDHGGLTLTTGRSYGFRSDSTAQQIERELAAAEAEDARR